VINPRDEIGRLTETFNTTLARLENSFNRTRRFSADVSHELRTPLTIIRGELEVGLKWAKDPEEFRELMQSNLEEVNRMSEIIESLLELSRAEEKGLSLNLQEVELHELLQDLFQQTSPLAGEKGLQFECDCTRPVCIQGDSMRLRQVFMNLLENALKYTESGGKVRLSLRRTMFMQRWRSPIRGRESRPMTFPPYSTVFTASIRPAIEPTAAAVLACRS